MLLQSSLRVTLILRWIVVTRLGVNMCYVYLATHAHQITFINKLRVETEHNRDNMQLRCKHTLTSVYQ